MKLVCTYKLCSGAVIIATPLPNRMATKCLFLLASIRSISPLSHSRTCSISFKNISDKFGYRGQFNITLFSVRIS